MKSFALASLFTVLATAAPTPVPKQARAFHIAAENAHDLDARQMGMGMTRNDLETGQSPCPRAIFVFARGSTEQGNMGAAVGPMVANTLTTQLGKDVWIQGVGGAYTAGVPENALPAGSSPAAIQEMERLLTLAHTKCPTSTILAGGYSQGAALAAAAGSGSSEAVRDQIGAVVLFGYTKNQQNSGKIPNYPADRVKVFCNPGDMVCLGSLVITPAHLNYAADASGPAPQFLESKLDTTAASTSKSTSKSMSKSNAKSRAKASSSSSDSQDSEVAGSASQAPASSALSSLAPVSEIPAGGNLMDSFVPQIPGLSGAATANPFTSLVKGMIPGL